MIGGKLKEMYIRSESCTVPWKEVKYFCCNLCQKEKILFSTFFLWLSFPFNYFHVVRALKPVLVLLAKKKMYFLIAHRAYNALYFLRNWAEKSRELLACPAHVCTSIPDLFGWRENLSDVMLSSQTLSHSGTLFISRCCCLFSGS